VRIAFFLTGRFPALTETFILSQITGLLDRGHEIEILAAGSDDRIVHPAVERYRLRERTRYWAPVPANRAHRALRVATLLARHAGRLGTLARAMDGRRYGRMASSLTLACWTADLLPRRDYDVLYCHFGWNGLYAHMLRDLGVLSGRLVTAFHGADLSWHLRRTSEDVYRPLFASGELFLPISERWRDRLVALGCPADRVRVHHMGIDCARLRPEPRTLGPREALRLVSVSRLVEKKGIEYALRAVARLVANGLDVRYDVVGDGPLSEPLVRLAGELGLGPRVRFLGARGPEEVPAVLRSAHIAVAPSVIASDGDEEGIPVGLMEAMATGMPVVSTRHSGIPELVEDGVSGQLVPERDVDALAAALESLAARPERWPAMGQAGRRRVEREFDLGLQNERLARLLAAAAGGSAAPAAGIAASDRGAARA